MIKPILRFLFKHFKAEYASILYEVKKTPKDFDNMEHCFTDSHGVQYFTWADKQQIPGLRFAQCESLVVQIMAAISHEEWGKFLTDMLEAINRQEDGKFIPNIGRIAALIDEMNKRNELILHPALMYELMATLYVREDENPLFIDDTILEQKSKQFIKDSQTGLYDFFFNRYIQAYLQYINMPEDEWTRHWNLAQLKLKSMEKFLNLSTIELKALTGNG